MARYAAKSLHICAIGLIIASFASIATGFTLEEFILKIQHLEQNDEILMKRVAQMEELNKLNVLKIQQLESEVIELKAQLQTSQRTLQSAVQENGRFLAKQGNQRNALFRTCNEIHQADPLLTSGMYWIDPDGLGVGDDPIYVECDMASGKTAILHDSELPTDVGHCADPGCYSRPIKYSASTRQMDALAELSNECHQSIKYECNYATLETNGVAQSWWNDRNGVAQYFWSGSNNSVHICQCGIDQNCIELYYLCNCDSAVPLPLDDTGVITDKQYLPITRLNFGRTQLQTSSGVHTLGRFECTGQTVVDGSPTSCFDLWKIGHVLSGFYPVRGGYNVEMVYCDFSKVNNDLGFQNWIGLVDVKSSPVYFHVSRSTNFNESTPITFDTEILNTGRAMNMTSGIFTAPRNGTYSFSFSAVVELGATEMNIDFRLKKNEWVVSRAHAHDTIHEQATIHATITLEAGDQVWADCDSIYFLFGGFIDFTGWQLQEELAFQA